MRDIEQNLFNGEPAEDLIELIRHGANVNAKRDYDGVRPLHEAVANPDYVRQLLEAGANPNAVDDRGYTALHQAATGGSAESCRLLLDAGADVNARSDYTKRTPLHSAMEAVIECPEICQVLIERGAEVNAPDHVGNTPLHWSMMVGVVTDASRTMRPLPRVLIDGGADPDIRNHENNTPLDLASPEERDDIGAYIAERLAAQFEANTAKIPALPNLNDPAVMDQLAAERQQTAKRRGMRL